MQTQYEGMTTPELLKLVDVHLDNYLGQGGPMSAGGFVPELHKRLALADAELRICQDANNRLKRKYDRVMRHLMTWSSNLPAVVKQELRLYMEKRGEIYGRQDQEGGNDRTEAGSTSGTAN